MSRPARRGIGRNREMKRYTINIAVASFFILAFVGWINGVPLFVCSTRAAAGAVAIYLLVSLAGKAAIRIFVDAAVARPTEPPLRGTKRDYQNR